MIAQRLRRTRQQLGSYRHDITIAMRLVNRIEREILRSELENWLLDEILNCKKLSFLLQEKSNNLSLSTKGRLLTGLSELSTEKNSTNKEILEALQIWRKAYCESCIKEQTFLTKK